MDRATGSSVRLGYCDCNWRIGTSTESGKVAVIVLGDSDFPTMREIDKGAVGNPGLGEGQLEKTIAPTARAPAGVGVAAPSWSCASAVPWTTWRV